MTARSDQPLAWLRLTRGRAHFFVPAASVRRVSVIPRPVPLPLTPPWVLGLAADNDGRWLPVVDLLAATGSQADRRAVAALVVLPGGEPFAWLLTDTPGLLADCPAEAGAGHPALPWLRRAISSAQTPDRWICDATVWAEMLAQG